MNTLNTEDYMIKYEDDPLHPGIVEGTSANKMTDFLIKFRFDSSTNIGTFDIFPFIKINNGRGVLQCSILGPQNWDDNKDLNDFIDLIGKITAAAEIRRTKYTSIIGWSRVGLEFYVKYSGERNEKISIVRTEPEKAIVYINLDDADINTTESEEIELIKVHLQCVYDNSGKVEDGVADLLIVK